eukprot:SAG11_NODE_153_length_14352_cov_24.348323_11_plen_133_part_00
MNSCHAKDRPSLFCRFIKVVQSAPMSKTPAILSDRPCSVHHVSFDIKTSLLPLGLSKCRACTVHTARSYHAGGMRSARARSKYESMQPDTETQRQLEGSTVLRLQGHLFDTGLINQVWYIDVDHNLTRCSRS